MCGIVGYIGSREAGKVILSGLKRLEYRGYDSCGIATFSNGININKDIGMIEEIQERIELADLEGTIGIGHTRWATHGGVTRENAHPHSDCNNDCVIVHNGIISNYLKLKEELINSGHVFKSDTDSEVIVHLIEQNYNGDMEKALVDSLKSLKGTYAVLALSKNDPEKLFIARNESPLVLGLGDGEFFVGSDISSFLKFTNRAIPLDDGEYAIIDRSGYTIKEIDSGKTIEKEIMEVDWSDEMAQKEGYPHFMLKEIYEQPQTISNALNIYPQDFQKLAKMIKDADRVYLSAAGTSLNAAMVSEYWFSNMAKQLVIPVDSSELAGKGLINDRTLVIGISQSGETYDTLSSLKYAKGKGAKIASIVNVIGSTATRMSDHSILQGSGIEISVCATKTYTSQLTILLKTAIELARMGGKDVSKLEGELLKVPDYIYHILEEVKNLEAITKEYLNVHNYLFIGKGINLPTAMEGALKLKEITYLHAEGMSSGLLKHGTISLIDETINTVAFVPSKGENRTKIINNIQEIKARGGKVLGIVSGEKVPQCDENIQIMACNEKISPLLFAPIFQLLAYHASIELGRNVDKPRSLAKSVTVE